jgi:hypothetical protein
MKIYSDVLDINQICRATPRDCYVGNSIPIQHPRVRSKGWYIHLDCPASNRYKNSGIYGASEQGAASYDQYGEWFNNLFAIDPNARIAEYQNAYDFHIKTAWKYVTAASWIGVKPQVEKRNQELGYGV